MTSGRRKFLRTLTIIWVLSACRAMALAQQDTTMYILRTPASVSLEALRGPATAAHPLTAANVVLRSSRWRARCTAAAGATVTFQTDHSFWNLSAPGYKRDAILRLTRLVGPPRGGWVIDIAQDQTDYAAGDEVATVSMSSTAAGPQRVRMEVEFVTGDLATLRDGDYQLTVIGTIAAN